jgi:hypothetical protein
MDSSSYVHNRILNSHSESSMEEDVVVGPGTSSK